jgi:hypothetical protein
VQYKTDVPLPAIKSIVYLLEMTNEKKEKNHHHYLDKA